MDTFIRFQKSANPSQPGPVVSDENPFPVTGTIRQAASDFETAGQALAAFGGFPDVNWEGGDFVTREQTSNGQAIVALSASPMSPGESRVVVDVPVQQPCRLDFEGSVVRNRQQFVSAGLFANAESGPEAPLDPIAIESISQSSATDGAAYTGSAGTVVTLVLSAAVPAPGEAKAVYLSDLVHVVGHADSRLNYQNAAIRYISPDRKTICFGFTDEAALPSLAIPVVVGGGAVLHFYNNAAGAANGAGYRFTGTTPTSTALWSVFGGGDVQISGTLQGDHRVSVASSDPVVVAGVMGSHEIKASSRYRIEVRPDNVCFLDKVSDSTAGYSTRGPRGAVKPHIDAILRPRFRVYQPPGMSRPVSAVVQAVHGAASTVTVATLPVTPSSVGIQVGTIVAYKGARDQTNFVSTSTAAAVTAIDDGAKTVTFAWGAAAVATTRGGVLCVINGGADQPGIIAQAVSTVANRTDNPDWITVGGSAAWSGLAVAQYINLAGVRADSDGSDLALDGVWQVAHVATTALTLKPVIDIRGIRQSPATPTISGTVNAGGAVLVRTTARIHDLQVVSIGGEQEVFLAGQGTARQDLAVPVRLLVNDAGSTTQNVTGGTAEDSPAPNPVNVGGKARNANPAAMSATGDLISALMTMIGAAVNKPFSIPEADWSYPAASGGIVNSAAAVTIKAAAGTGLRNYITGLDYSHEALTNATELAVRDGAAGPVIWRRKLPSGVAKDAAITFPDPLKGSANTLLEVVTLTASGAGAVYFNATGYAAP